MFDGFCHALGDELFNDFVAEYAREAPPESYTLYDLGRRFTDYLEVNRPDRDEELRESWIDFIVDLARFERSVFCDVRLPGCRRYGTGSAGYTRPSIKGATKPFVRSVSVSCGKVLSPSPRENVALATRSHGAIHCDCS